MYEDPYADPKYENPKSARELFRRLAAHPNAPQTLAGCVFAILLGVAVLRVAWHEHQVFAECVARTGDETRCQPQQVIIYVFPPG